MTCTLIIVAYMCLAQNAETHGHTIVRRAVPDPINNALAQVTNIATRVGNAILEADQLLKEYTDNSTDYAAVLNVDFSAELNATYKRFLAKMETRVRNSTSNPFIIATCAFQQRNNTELLVRNVTREVFKCGVTKIRKFVDMRVNLESLGNETVKIGPNTKAKIQACDQEGNNIVKYGCMTTALAGAATKLTQTSVSVTATVTAATAIYATFQPDLGVCAAAKLVTFRQTIIDIPFDFIACSLSIVMG